MSIELKTVKYIYMPKTPYERVALDDVSLTIEEGKLTFKLGRVHQLGATWKYIYDVMRHGELITMEDVHNLYVR